MKRVLSIMRKCSAIKKIIFILIITGIGQISFGQTIDIGLFESVTPNTIEVKLRPDFQINPDETISAILYTIAWDNPAIVITPAYYFPYFVAPQGPPVLDNGIYHQVFATVPTIPVGVTINPGDEILVSSFSYTGGDCSYFEIIEDEWTGGTNNGDYYVEFLGLDVTGIIYEPIVNLGSLGGFVDGSGTINLGQSTGPLTLTDYSGTVIQWEKRLNGGAWVAIPGTAGVTIFSEIPTFSGVWDYRAEVQKGTCPPVYALEAVVIVLDIATQWTGNISTDWFNLDNWTNGVPYEILDAIIPLVDPNPYPLIDGDATCYGLDIASGASVFIQVAGTLTTFGNFTNDGQFTIESTSAGDGSFINYGVIAGTGDFVVGRYLTSERWHYVSPPISDAVSLMFLDIYLKDWDEPSGTFNYIVPIDVDLNSMEGYGTWADDDLTGTTTVFYNGTLNTGDINSEVLTNTLGNSSTGYNFVGNPYPSATDWDIAAGWTKTTLDNAIYIWNPAVGQYGSYIGGASVNDVTNIIPGGQGFYVHVTNGNSTGSLTVNNIARLHDNKPFFKESGNIINTDQKLLKLEILSELNSFSDQAVVRFNEFATENFDPAFDAYDMLAGLDEAPVLYSVSADNADLSINTLLETEEDISIPLMFSVGVNGIYSIEALQIENFENKYIYLKDLQENILTDINNQPVYSFFGDVNDNPERFEILILNSFTGLDENTTSDELKIYSDRNVVYLINGENKFSGDLNIYDMAGKSVYSSKFQNSTSFEASLNVEKGFYIVKLVTDNTIVTEKVFITE